MNAWITPCASPTKIISMNMPHDTASPVRAVRSLLVRIVCHISLNKSNILPVGYSVIIPSDILITRSVCAPTFGSWVTIRMVIPS